MFIATAPLSFHRRFRAPLAFDRLIDPAAAWTRQPGCESSEDESTYTLRIDMPGVAKDQLNIGIEGSVVRIASKEGAPRQYKAAYELPQDIDVGLSEARLEHGVLTLRLGKRQPVRRVSELAIN
ncbi:MAG: Hsp20 family protein [Rhodoferax sp.]|nr:Hsp20 family protein [Rhodoferax sp.]